MKHLDELQNSYLNLKLTFSFTLHINKTQLIKAQNPKVLLYVVLEVIKFKMKTRFSLNV